MGLGSGIRDPGFGKNQFQIPEDPAQIPDPDPQHCIAACTVCMYNLRTYTLSFVIKKSCQSIQ